MTKFEEEAIKEAMKSGTVVSRYERGCGAPNIGLNLNLGRGVHNFPWLEFAKNWHSDEEFQEMKESYWNQAESILSMLDEIKSLKSQLQQQALPVVPECVGEFVSGDENELSKADRIAYLLKSVQGDSYYLTEELPGDGTITVDEGQELYNWAICQHHETILKLWNGYTVEKPQLFKAVFPNSTSVLQKNGELNSFADTVYKRYLLDNAMTEQEIKSIDERYWQFAVPVEDGE